MNAPESVAPTPPADATIVARAPLEQFAPSLTNRTHTDDYIAELGGSIKVHDVIQPITARPWPTSRGQAPEGILYEIVIGEGRWRGAGYAKKADIPFFWRDLTDEQALELQLIENLKRKDLTAIEEADGYRRLMKEHGHTADTIAEKIGKSRGYVYARLKLLDLCGSAREAFAAGQLDASTALLIARIPGETLQKRAVKEITTGYDGPLSYRNAKNHIRHHFTISLKQATFALDDAELVPAAGSCADCPKRSGNAPEICTDLDDVDVCTDTACFDDKRLTRRQQLITNAEKKGIQIFTGEKAKEIAPYGTHSLDDEKYVDLDEIVEGDGQDRTYRDILGDKAPVVALLEIGHGERGHLVELGDPTALEKALKKAGWQRDMFKEPESPAKGPPESEEQRAKREAEAAERAARNAAAEAENSWRTKLRDALTASLETASDGSLNTDPIIVALASAWVRQEEAWNGIPDELLNRFGITIPDEYDAAQELENVCEEIAKWPVGKALALLFVALTQPEDTVNAWDFDADSDRPFAMLAVAEAVDLDPEALRDPPPATAKVQPKAAKSKTAAPGKSASTPSPAAQAPEKGAAKPAAPAKAKSTEKKPAAKKAEEKTNPAPASPANEPAAPAKTSALKPANTWPFPTGNRPVAKTGADA